VVLEGSTLLPLGERLPPNSHFHSLRLPNTASCHILLIVITASFDKIIRISVAPEAQLVFDKRNRDLDKRVCLDQVSDSFKAHILHLDDHQACEHVVSLRPAQDGEELGRVALADHSDQAYGLFNQFNIFRLL